MAVGMLVPKSGKDFIDGPLSVLLVDQALLTVAQRLWIPVLQSVMSRKRFPLVAPSHI